MKNSSDALLASDKPERQAIGSWIFSLIDGTNPMGTGSSLRFMAKEGDIRRSDPPELGEFRVQIKGRDEEFLDQLFAPKGNQ